MSTTSHLKELSELLTDSQLGYAEAAERAEDPRLKQLLMKFGNGRAPMIEELANELARSGKDMPEEGTAKGSLHRTWIGIREKISKSDDENILAECARGEEYLVDRYGKAMESAEVPHHIRAMLQQHQVMIQSDLERIRTTEQMIKSNEEQ